MGAPMSRRFKNFRNTRLSLEGEEGFTLIELLIVMLILGILAAIALPAFFNQKSKAGDAKAKEYIHTAQVAIDTYAVENGGSYLNASATKLKELEPTLNSVGTIAVTGPTGGTSVPTATAYEITITSSSENTFSLINNGGSISFPCTVKTSTNRGGCPGTGSSGAWG
jgi:type IV pilus assembly protein PilA